ncbi:MAG: helix-turn-helix domain-containing protein [Dehalococcoidales bacterium]|nr:helix-turn-helix domain-containing protein [Dehalococcoidales bacterium]
MGNRAAETGFDELMEQTISTEVHEDEQDPLPEDIHYRDEGCDLARSCLNCPFRECIYEQPGGKQRWLMEERSAEMVRLYSEEGKSIGELAEIFKVSRRTVQRGLKASTGCRNRRRTDVRQF